MVVFGAFIIYAVMKGSAGTYLSLLFGPTTAAAAPTATGGGQPSPGLPAIPALPGLPSLPAANPLSPTLTPADTAAGFTSVAQSMGFGF